MSKSFCILFSIVLFAFCIRKEVRCLTKVRRYKINLDASPATRWQDIAHDYAHYFPYLRKILQQRIPAEVLPLAAKVALYLDAVFDKPYPEELKGLADVTDLTLPEVILANIFYDITAYCTSIVAQDDQGDIYHARNLDYDNADILRNMSMQVDFLTNGKVVYSGVTFAGYIGILTGQKPFAFTITLDERDQGYLWENIFQLLLAKAKPVGFFLRSLLANEGSDFGYAIEQISKVEMIAPAYIIVGGVKQGEGAVVTRARTEAIDVWRLNASEERWYLVETNYDHWKPPPSSDDRRDVAIKAMDKLGQDGVGVKALFNVMSTKPVLQSSTVFTSIMSAKFPSIFATWIRRCCT